MRVAHRISEGDTNIQSVEHAKSLEMGIPLIIFIFLAHSPQFGMCSEQGFEGRKGKEHS